MKIALYAWQVDAIRRFGLDPTDWRFQCPACQTVQSVRDFLALGLNRKQADLLCAQLCIRRWTDGGCSYRGGPVQLLISPGEIRPTFEFAP